MATREPHDDELSGSRAAAEQYRVHNGLADAVTPGEPYDPSQPDAELAVASEPEGGFGGEGEGKGAIGLNRDEDGRNQSKGTEAENAQLTAEALREGASIPEEDKLAVFPDPDVDLDKDEKAKTSGSKAKKKS